MSCSFNCLLGLTHNSRSAYFYIKAVLPLGCDETVKPLLTVGGSRPAQLSIEPESNKALVRVGRDGNRQRMICIWTPTGRFGSGLIPLLRGERNPRGMR